MTIEADVKPAARKNWTIWHTLALLLIVVAIGALGITQPRQPAFISTLVLFTLFATIAGHGTVGLWMGVLIDERNRMSLARLQTVLWTVLILSGYLTAALSNIFGDVVVEDPLAIGVPQEIWALLGISATSLVGSPLILSTKAREPPVAEMAAMTQRNAEAQRTLTGLASQGLEPGTVTTKGKLVVWEWPEDAHFADLFQGDEIGNASHLDLGKVQMFFFTLVLVLAYGVALYTTDTTTMLPELGPGMVALLGISHAGYLANKAVPHSTP